MQPASRSVPSLLISLILFLCAMFLLIISFFVGVSALFPFIFGGRINPDPMILGTVFVAEAIILCLATFFCIQKYMNQASAEVQAQFQMPVWLILTLIPCAGIPIAIGYFVSGIENINWFALPLLTLPAVLVPIYLLLGLGTKSIGFGPRWRAWGIFGMGMTIGPLLLFFIELIILVFIFVILVLVAASQPDLNREIQFLAEQIQQVGDEPEALLDLMLPYIFKSQVVALLLLFFSGVAPLVEELFKPLGVWLFAGKLESPAQGFALGALSGGAFALVETFGSSAQAMDWAGLIGARIATGLMHIISTALMGWGTALVWRERKYLMLIFAYSGSFLLHSAWNGNIILYSLSTIAREADPTNPFARLAPITFGIAILLSVIMLGILVFANRKLRQKNTTALTEIPESITA